MPLEIRAWKFAVPLVGTLFLAAACSSNNTTSGCDAACERDSLQTFFAGPSTPGATDIPEQNIARQTAAAADRVPVGGSGGGVSQGGVSVTTAVRWVPSMNDDDVETFEVTITDAGPGPFTIDTRTDLAGAGTNTNLVQGGTLDVVTFRQPEGTAALAGTLHVWASEAEDFGGDDDFLAYGFWLHDPDGITANDIPLIGAFVDSNMGAPFTGNNLANLTGSATYSGQARGLYHEEVVGGTSNYASWAAAAALTASFDDTDTIAGTINTFTFNGPEGFSSPTVSTVTLASTGFVGTGEGGFFTGTTSADVTIGDAAAAAYTGDWGGKFYVDGAAATDHPDWVAGTFGLRSPTADTTATRAFLGVFTADLDE